MNITKTIFLHSYLILIILSFNLYSQEKKSTENSDDELNRKPKISSEMLRKWRQENLNNYNEAKASEKIKTRYAEYWEEFPLNSSEEKVLAAIKQLKNSCFMQEDGDLEIDLFFIPNRFYSKFEITFKSLIDPEGRNLKISPVSLKNMGNNFFHRNGIWSIFKSQFLPKDLKKSKTLFRVKGTIKCRVPVSFNKCSLTINDIGKEKQIGDKKLILDYLKGDLCKFRLEKGNKFKPILTGYDINDTPITSTYHWSSFDYDNYRYCRIRKDGNLHRVEIFIPKKYIEKEIEFTAYQHPENGGSVENPRFIADKRLKFSKMTEQELKKKTKITFEKYIPKRKNEDYDEDDFFDLEYIPERPAGIIVNLPKVNNSFYAKVDLENIICKDSAGNPISGKVRIIRRSAKKKYSAKLMAVKYPDKDNPFNYKEIKYTSIEGVAVIKYPLKVRTETFQVGQKASDYIKLTPGKITIDTTLFSLPEYSFVISNSSESFPSIRAYAENGKLLASLGISRTWIGNGKLKKIECSFWGKPIKYEWDVVEKYAELKIPFSFKAE